MKNTITITDITKVRVGDKAYIKNCDFGFTVTSVDPDDKHCPIAVYNPLSEEYYWIFLPRFDHATREVKEPEWPHPEDLELHIYIGADGKQYLYAPAYEDDHLPWKQLPHYRVHEWHDAEGMAKYYQEALPLKELKLVPKDEEA